MAASLEVTETLTRFAKSRQLLRDVYASAGGHFDQLRSILRDEFVRAEIKLHDSEMFLSDDDLAVLEKVLDNDPVIIVSGQTNCGKTSLINELLGGSYLPTSAIPCTARIVKVRYSEINYLQVFDSENKELCEKIEFQKTKIPTDEINLESSSRDEQNVVECVVEVGLDSELLRQGLQIIDVPGLSETTALDKLVEKQLDGMLQLVIYVIDGKTSLRTQDTTFISHLKTTAPMAEILFVCNKVEDNPDARKMDRFSDQESDEEEERPDRARMTFSKLKEAGLLPSDLQYSSELQYYHGLSCSLIRKARLAKKHREYSEEYVKNFDRFKDALLKTFSRCVNKHLCRAVSGLLGCQQRVFDFFISDKMTRVIKTELLEHIRVITEKEETFQTHLMNTLSNSWAKDIEDMLEESLTTERDAILESVQRLEFKHVFLDDQSCVDHINLLRHCRLKIREYVLMLIIQKFEIVLKRIGGWFDNEVRKRHESDSRVDNTLRNQLASIWRRDDMNFDMSALMDIWVAGLHRSVRTKLKQTMQDMEVFVKGMHFDKEWKKNTASDVLKTIDTGSLTKHILKAIQEKLRKDHQTFSVAMTQIQNLCLLKEKQAHEHKVIVDGMISAYSKNLCITNALANTIRNGAVQLGEKIGQGSRSDVFECQTYMDLQNIVAKKSKVPAEIPNGDFCTLSCYVKLLGDCEFHANVTTVAFDTMWHFCVILPKYERNLYDLLSSDNHGLSLEERVTMCFEMAKMCEYSAEQGLFFNDLRPNSFFVDTSRGKTTLRFNLSKWKDMSAPYPDGKPPFHFAPEIVLKKSLPRKTFDSYSLTVLLVQLAIGKIVRPKFSENEETIKEIQTLPEKDYVGRLRDDFLEIWEDKWEDKESCVYSTIQSLINKYIGTIPSDRKGIETFMHDVEHTLLKRLNDRTPDMSSSSASSDDHDSITRFTSVPNHYAAETFDVISGSPQRRLQHGGRPPPFTRDVELPVQLRFNDASTTAGPATAECTKLKSRISFPDMASSLEVSETLIRFAKSRQLLRDMYASARGHFDQLRSILSDQFVRSLTEQDGSEMFLSDDDLAVLEKVLDNDPVIIVSGQSNCGKTSLINELLGGMYLPTPAISCAARIVKVRYSEINYLQVFDSENKKLCERIEFQKKKVPEDKINWKAGSRAEDNVVECVVEVGLSNELLRHGLQIIDVPGLSENAALDMLVEKHLDGLLQLVIYVIDGKKLLTTPDTKFISHLKATAPMAEILFVCNKVEDDAEARKMDRFDEGSDEEEQRPDRAKLVFGRLRKAGLLPSDLQYSTELQYYHGLSCSNIRKARLAKEPREDLDEYAKNFDRFKDALLKTFSRCVNKHLYRAVSGLLGCQQRVFEFFKSDKMTRLTKMELVKHIRFIIEKEETFQTHLKHVLSNSWAKDIEKMLKVSLKTETGAILEIVQRLEVTPIDLNDQSCVDHIIIIRDCRRQIREYVLMVVIQKFEIVLKQIGVWFDDEVSCNARVARGSVSHRSDSRVDHILQNLLASIIGLYWERDQMNVDMSALMDIWVAGLHQRTTTKLKQTMQEAFVKGIYLQNKWKEDTASDVLKTIDTESLTKHILNAIQEKLRKDHQSFLFAMQQVKVVCLLKDKHAHEHKIIVDEMIAAHSKNLCITNALANTLRHGAVQLGEKIGQGSRSDVFECQTYMDFQNIVAKKSKVPAETPNGDSCMLFCYVRLLEDCEFHAKVTTVAFDSQWHFCVILPKYERNLYDLLSSDDHGLSLEERVTMCYDMTKMCEYSAKQGICLNDLRPNSFFVDTANEKPTLRFNLSKWKDMSAPYPDGKPPFHFAPEVLLEKSLSHKTSDAYSLTVLLVQLAIGKLVRPKFSENEKAIKVIQTFPEKDYVRHLRDDFLKIWEENWEDKERCVYSIIQSFINTYIGTIPSDRMGVERFMHDVKHTLLKRLNDRTPDMNSSSASSDDHDSRTRSNTVPTHYAAVYHVINSGREKAHFTSTV